MNPAWLELQAVCEALCQAHLSQTVDLTDRPVVACPTCGRVDEKETAGV